MSGSKCTCNWGPPPRCAASCRSAPDPHSRVLWPYSQLPSLARWPSGGSTEPSPGVMDPQRGEPGLGPWTVNVVTWALLRLSRALLCCCYCSVGQSVVSDSLRPQGLQHARLPCPSPPPELAQTHVHRVGDAISICLHTPNKEKLTTPQPPGNRATIVR